jgi:uncharacterized protein YggT (Ycf19 family)
MQLLGPVHFLLNVVGLLLWLRWREEVLESSRRVAGATLLSTLRKAGSAPSQRWTCLGLLAGLAVLRGLAYWHLGSAAGWNPSLDLGAITLPFRSDHLGRMMVFSIGSLALFTAQFYFWLLLLSVVNRKVPDSDPYQNRLRAHLGRVERWPAFLKLLLPVLLSASVWAAVRWLLVKAGVLPPARSGAPAVQQALLIALASLLVWKYLIAGVLLLHLATSYVYLGRAPFWNFISLTGRNLLSPVRWLPLRFGRIDLAPLLGAALVLFLGELAARGLPRLYEQLLTR